MMEVIQLHSSTIELLYVYGCAGVTAAGVNSVLSSCPLLRTISHTTCEGLDYTLMGNLNTLITKYAFEDHNLKHLHLVFEAEEEDLTMYDYEKMRLERALTKRERDELGSLQSIAIAAWYKFSDLPI